MKKLFTSLSVLCLASFTHLNGQGYDPEGFPDRDLFGNYIIIRITPLSDTKEESVAAVDKFKTWCEENTYMKPFTSALGYFQVKSIEKNKNTKWFGGYCNYKRQKKELYEMDLKFIQSYCGNAEIYQFKQVIKNDNCPPEK